MKTRLILAALASALLSGCSVTLAYSEGEQTYSGTFQWDQPTGKKVARTASK